MLATIWHEIVSWFLTISQDLRNMITKLFLFWFSYQCRTILWSQQTRTGKKPEINKQCHVKWWLKYRNNRLVSWRLSCIIKLFGQSWDKDTMLKWTGIHQILHEHNTLDWTENAAFFGINNENLIFELISDNFNTFGI